MFNGNLKRYVLVLLLCLAVGISANAQTTTQGSIAGTVFDSTRAVISGATITIPNNGTTWDLGGNISGGSISVASGTEFNVTNNTTLTGVTLVGELYITDSSTVTVNNVLTLNNGILISTQPAGFTTTKWNSLARARKLSAGRDKSSSVVSLRPTRWKALPDRSSWVPALP